MENAHFISNKKLNDLQPSQGETVTHWTLVFPQGAAVQTASLHFLLLPHKIMFPSLVGLAYGFAVAYMP